MPASPRAGETGGVSLRRLSRTLLAALIGYALPPRCPGCGTVVLGDHLFCAACWRLLDFVPEDCAADLLASAGARLDSARALLFYAGAARTVVLRLKQGRPALARTMARLMRGLLQDCPPDALLVAVPLHRARLWRRGYNQALLLARALARGRPHACPPDLLVRRRATPLLRGLGRAARRAAVAEAFVVPPHRRPMLAGRAVVLIDDVVTSGATAGACAAALRAAGAQAVHLRCWARTPPPGASA
ncbi:ComF family protein [Sphingomonas morindae]|uniref:Double zinc ribbon domain-containing protein n=1 Tax=Sphingomonas morindae TaxID=1541170 RepID=A0ABY4X5P0_9SPHN|nr:double zinc ribbon domain-containing protein [Sphingomonas morindae]USI72205.1 double zinc ribbon domain-containing protein [Sphingomonas morindae]